MIHEARPLVHIVDVDDEAQRLVTRWLAAAGIESRTYSHLGAFLSAHCADHPGCLVIDPQPSAICGLEPRAILLPLAIRYPGVVMEKPLREGESITAICAAIEQDRQRLRIASRHAELLVRFETLSRRERQVMALVTAGKLNKQVGGDLGLSIITVKAHRGAVMRKMGARSIADLVRMADVIANDGIGAQRRYDSMRSGGPASALYCAMVLLNDVVEVAARPNLNISPTALLATK